MNKPKLNRTLILVGTTAVSGWLLAGCATKGYQQADKTGASIATFREEILSGKKAIDATMTSLSEVETSAATDPRKAYDGFSKNVDNLESTANTIKKRAQDMREKGKAYFTKWEQELAQVKNPEIQKL